MSLLFGNAAAGYAEACARDRQQAYRRQLLDIATDIANGRHAIIYGAEMVALVTALETAMAGYARPNAIAALKAAVARYPQRSLESIIADATAVAAWLEGGRTDSPADAGQGGA